VKLLKNKVILLCHMLLHMGTAAKEAKIDCQVSKRQIQL